MLSTADLYNKDLRSRLDRFHMNSNEEKYYKDTLDITGTGIMGYVSIPKIKIEYPIYHGTDEGVLQTAIGHLEYTSLPTGGKGNHSAVSGHRGLPSARLFTDIDRLRVGDKFSYTVLNRKVTYKIKKIVTVEPDDMAPLDFDNERDLSTLVTCTPYGVNSHRLMITGEAIKTEIIKPDIQKAKAKDTKNSYRKNLLIFIAICIASLLFIALIIYLVFFKNRNIE